MGNHANISIFVPHNGCPQKCSFCNQNSITGVLAQPVPEEVERLLSDAGKRLGGRAKNAQVAFFGGSFTAIDRGYMKALLAAAQKACMEYGFSGIRISTRPDAIDEEGLDILHGYGVRAIELGAQSMDAGVLKANLRGHGPDDVKRASKLISGHGFELGLQMMTGLYTDTGEKSMRTAREIVRLRPSTVRIYPTVVLENTLLAELYRRGEYRPQTLEEAVELCSKLLLIFERAGIKVIRMGLHAEESLESKKLAGPYHPAFRELCESRLFFEELESELKKRPAGEYIIKVNSKSRSLAVGNKKENVINLSESGYKVIFENDDSLGRRDFSIDNKEESTDAFKEP